MKRRILISCREPECRGELTRLLSGRGVDFTIVLDEADFLLELLQHDYQAVIYDLENLHLDGLKMVRIAKLVRPKVPLIVISNDTSQELGGKILQEGVAHYAVKPVNSEVLKGVVSNLLKLEVAS